MTNTSSRTGLPATLTRRGLMAASASAAVVLLAACSGTSGGGASTAATTPAAATASSTPSATPSASPTTGTGTPTAESAVKELVPGFPATAVPLMKGAEIQATSIAHAGPVSTASMTATITASSADVLAHYTKVFTDMGFTAQPGDSVDGVPLKTFVRTGGQEIATVSVVQTGSTATFTIGATLLQASFK